MKKVSLKPIKNKDLSLLWVLLLGLVLFAIKLVLSRAQNVFLAPDASELDDMVLYNSAVAITKGEWLGSYGWMTLSKHSFYSLWLAVMHWLHIPALASGQILWGIAGFVTAFAVYPVLKKRWLSLALFALLLFNPASIANPSPLGFVSRIYRDNIFPALCLLCVAGMLGAAFRYKEGISRTIGWLIVAGLAFAACWLCREDGWWLLPFMVIASVVILVFIIKDNDGHKVKRSLALCVPFILLLVGTTAWKTANYVHYGRFIISDFSSGEFADAYGALTRVKSDETDSEQVVPQDVRQKLYSLVPEFAVLEPYLESASYLESYGNYNSGSFYWALREAASEAGIYDTPQKAEEYFTKLAVDVNALCEDGILEAGPKRSSVSPSIQAKYIAPVSAEALHGIVFTATFQQSDPRALFSPGSNDAAFYEEKIQPMEEFLGEKAITVTHENTIEPVYTQFQNISYKLLDLIRLIYSVLLPIGFCAALVWQVIGCIRLVGRVRNKEKDPQQTLFWFVQLGILFCIVLRAFMIAFVTVVSFKIGTYIMYLASIHPLMILYAFCGSVALVRYFVQKRGKTKQKDSPTQKEIEEA